MRAAPKFSAQNHLNFYLMGLAVFWVLVALVHPVKADQKSELANIEQEISELRAETKNQERVIQAMQSMVEASYKPGGAAPDPRNLEAMGQAGSGAVGAGATKAKPVREMIEEYESLLNTRNYKGVGRLYGRLLRERRQLVQQYKAANGLKPDQFISKDVMDRE